MSPLLLTVWREVCRHLRIDESTTAIARLLPADSIVQVLVRHIDLARCCLETVAVAYDTDQGLAGGRTECNSEAIKLLLAWCNRGAVMVVTPQSEDPLARLLIPFEIRSDCLVGPLGGAGGPSGLLVLAAPPGRRFSPDDAQRVQSLLEPFSVALENDQRLREIAALREAAEADRTSLLSRLGRQAIGDTIVGEESGLRAVMERVELVGRSDVPVLIFGETGTGKELVARAIHNRSRRHSGPFLRVNCGAIPPELIDSQLFGHERGSFTGAVDTHQGWFERADRGTLFLDEIGELPLAAQVRLLRVLQDGVFERVGGQQPINVDVRIVAATHRDLSSMVREARFREDLWYRLAVFPISLPPLRDRRDDIPALARHFAQRAAIRFGLTPCELVPHDIRLLVSYAWPGNVRELASVMDRAAILGDGHRLDVATALGVPTTASSPQQEPATAPAASESAEIVTLDEAMRRHIQRALAAVAGRIEGRSGAADLLGINPHTLRARMRKLGIDWSRFRKGPAGG